MERDKFTLRRLVEIHGTAYLAENKSRRTVEWHTAVVHRFADWVVEALDAEPTIRALTLDNVRAWIMDLHEQPRFYKHPTNEQPDARMTDETVSWYVRGLRAFSSWLEREGYVKANPLAKLKTPKTSDKEVEILTPDEITRIMHGFNYRTEIGSRDLAIFSFMLDTGVRASEACGLKLSNLHLDQGYAVVFGKGKKERPVKIGSRSAKAIRFYLTHWRKPARANIDNVFLTVGHTMGDDLQLWGGNGEPLTLNALQRIIRRIGKRAGVDRMYPHLLRHTFACMYLMEHHDPFALKNLLGHTSLTMTYRYVRAVERLMVVKGEALSVLDSLELPTPTSIRKRA